MENIKAVIFDLDGVLCFTDKYHYLAWKSLADEYGIYFDRKINDRLRGVSRMDSLNIILERSEQSFTEEEKVAMTEVKNSRYREMLGHMTPTDVTDETRRTLTELKNRGYLLAVGSSSKNTKYILSQTELTGYFDAVADGNDITKSKPDPEVFLAAAKKLGARPEFCAVVEDAYAGIRAAKAGHMTAVAFGGDAVDSSEKDAAIKTFSGLLDLLPGV